MSSPPSLRQLTLWSQKSVNRRIFAAIVTVGSLSFVVKIVATLKEVVVARQFGVTDGLDALLIAYLIPQFAANVVAGSFNAALIPTYTQVRERDGEAAAQRLFSSVMVWSAGLLIIFSVALGVASHFVLPALGSGFSPEKLALTRRLFFIVLPTLPLSGMFVIWSAVLNAGERFALAAIAPVMTPVIVMLSVYGWGGQLGIYAFAFALVLGSVVEASIIAVALRRRGISPVPRWHGMTPALRQANAQYVPMVAAALMMCSTGLVDQSMAAMLGPGSVSVLNYGNKISSVIVTIGATAVSTAVLPQFSRMVATDAWEGVRKTLGTYMRLILYTTVPLTLGMVLASRWIVELLFQHGAFTARDTALVASVQSLYILQLPFYVCGMLFVRLISALKQNHILMWGTAISVVVNVSLDYLFMKRIGVSGIALSTSVVYLVSFCYLGWMSSSLLRAKTSVVTNT